MNFDAAILWTAAFSFAKRSSPDMSGDIARLIDIMAALRTPGTGCPWDLEQDFRSIAPYTIEEAYEVADAIESGDLAELKDELGDLLLQVVFHARMAQEQGVFAFPDVVAAICNKLTRRHPHVFGDAAALTPAGVTAKWNEIKAAEKAAKGASAPEKSSGRRSARPARAHPRREASAESLRGRLRLEQCGPCHGQDSGGDRGSRRGTGAAEP